MVDAGHAEGVSVGFCGELAGDPGAAILLMAMGYDVLSMNATNLPKVKSVIRSISLEQSRALLSEVMSLPDADQIRQRVDDTLQDLGATRLIRPASSTE